MSGQWPGPQQFCTHAQGVWTLKPEGGPGKGVNHMQLKGAVCNIIPPANGSILSNFGFQLGIGSQTRWHAPLTSPGSTSCTPL